MAARPGPRLLLCMLLSALLPALASGAEDDEAAFLRAAPGRLRSTDPQARAQALTRLQAWRGEPAQLTRLVEPLSDVIERRSGPEGALATRVLARIPGEAAAARFVETALGPACEAPVLLAALEGMAHRRDDVATLKLLLERVRDPGLPETGRALALQALGAVSSRVGWSLLLKPLAGSADPEPWLLASARALGLARVDAKEALPALLQLLEHPDPAPRVHAWEALVAHAGLDYPAERAPWQAWFDDGARPVPVPAAPPVRYREDEAVPAHVPRYYGIPIDRPRSRVVFCLDVSQSMYGRGIDGARRELGATIRDMPTTYAFTVVAFNERVMPYGDTLIPAHPVLKHRVLAWVARLETLSYTNLYDAVETAFGLGGVGPRAVSDAVPVDAVYLLSDGEPNRGRHRRDDAVVKAIAALSERRIPVHAIAAGEEVFPLLRRIAQATGGRFVDAFEFD